MTRSDILKGGLFVIVFLAIVVGLIYLFANGLPSPDVVVRVRQ